MSAHSALGDTTLVAGKGRTRRRRRERKRVPTRWNDPVVAVFGFVTDPIERVPGPTTGTPLPRYRRRSIPRAIGRFVFRATLVLLVLAIAAGAGAVAPYLRYQDEARRADDAQALAASTAAQLETANSAAADSSAKITQLRTELGALRAQVQTLRDARVRTVVETKTVTEEVIRWVPNGTDLAVELTGFEGVIGIHDVQITHSYGFTDIVGIAVNRSGHTISYAQLGCTFLDEDGKVLANAITNKQGWAPEQTWGFTCSAQVDAAGGILRVDEMS